MKGRLGRVGGCRAPGRTWGQRGRGSRDRRDGSADSGRALRLAPPTGVSCRRCARAVSLGPQRLPAGARAQDTAGDRLSGFAKLPGVD